ncbi:integral membrane protein [Zalerion maritima]|uniref:Integral membrane protein n=1 Tax=Zalerion maritima TaxID=339359 RepID=A0AAD5RXF2_9PEZI|nr:integral membrane protein [Zalerion maritima]
MGIGRIICVALPFILTACSLICILVAGLAGVADKSLYMFRVNVTGMEFDPTTLDVENLISSRDAEDTKFMPRSPEVKFDWHDERLLEKDDSNNVTSSDLGLADLYDISLWGYCSTDSDGDRTCKKGKFNWASTIVNDTLDQFSSAAALSGENIELPDEIESALKAFSTVVKWTEVAYIAAMVGLAIELFFGVFATCSRAFGCITFIVASVAAIIVCAAASLSTATSVIVVGTVEATAKYYGVRSNFNTTYLAFAWLGAAFALGAGFFWMFTVCCCASSHHSSSRGFKARSVGDGEKNPPTGAYQPLGEQHEMTPPPFYSSGQYGNRANAGRSDMAYEPYSHSRV